MKHRLPFIPTQTEYSSMPGLRVTCIQPRLGIKPSTQVCALTGNWAHSPQVMGWCSNQLSHTSQGKFFNLNAEFHNYLILLNFIILDLASMMFWNTLTPKIFQNLDPVIQVCHLFFPVLLSPVRYGTEGQAQQHIVAPSLQDDFNSLNNSSSGIVYCVPCWQHDIVRIWDCCDLTTKRKKEGKKRKWRQCEMSCPAWTHHDSVV